MPLVGLGAFFGLFFGLRFGLLLGVLLGFGVAFVVGVKLKAANKDSGRVQLFDPLKRQEEWQRDLL